MVTEALLAALTTWLMIRAGRAVTNNTFMVSDLIWIFVVQSASYIAGALSWYFAERAGFRAFGRYICNSPATTAAVQGCSRTSRPAKKSSAKLGRRPVSADVDRYTVLPATSTRS